MWYDGGPNGICLAEGQRRYRRYGSSYPEDPTHRSPRPDEPPDPDWTPADDVAADQNQDFVRDLTYVVTVRAGKARDDVRRGAGDRARGRLDAWQEILALLVKQAEIFGLSSYREEPMSLATSIPSRRRTATSDESIGPKTPVNLRRSDAVARWREGRVGVGCSA